MTNKLRKLFETHGLMSMNKQRALAEYLGRHAWDFDATTGKLQFSPGRAFAVQVLGSEVGPADKRLWCWAHANTTLPPELRLAADRLKALGEAEGVEEFVVPKLPRERLESHVLGFAALGLLDAPGYYRGVLGDTATLFLISDPDFPSVPPLSGTGFITTIGDAISSYDFRNHKEAVSHFFHHLTWAPEWTKDGFEVIASDGVKITGVFDERDRLHKLSTRAAAETVS